MPIKLRPFGTSIMPTAIHIKKSDLPKIIKKMGTTGQDPLLRECNGIDGFNCRKFQILWAEEEQGNWFPSELLDQVIKDLRDTFPVFVPLSEGRFPVITTGMCEKDEAKFLESWKAKREGTHEEERTCPYKRKRR